MERNANEAVGGTVWNVPNFITIARIDLTIFCFLCLSLGWIRAGLVCYVIAAATDWVDGWWARRFDQVTQFGRVVDPFADKLLICGLFVYLSAMPGSGVAPWMAVVVLGRELLVTTLRSFVESSGGDFSAKWLGKLKMVAQCVAGGLSLLQVSPWAGALDGLGSSEARFDAVEVAIWASLVFTLWSGADYLRKVLPLLMTTREENSGSEAPRQ